MYSGVRVIRIYWKKIRSSVWGILNLGCSWDTQMKISNGSVDKWDQSSGLDTYLSGMSVWRCWKGRGHTSWPIQNVERRQGPEWVLKMHNLLSWKLSKDFFQSLFRRGGEERGGAVKDTEEQDPDWGEKESQGAGESQTLRGKTWHKSLPYLQDFHKSLF